MPTSNVFIGHGYCCSIASCIMAVYIYICIYTCEEYCLSVKSYRILQCVIFTTPKEVGMDGKLLPPMLTLSVFEKFLKYALKNCIFLFFTLCKIRRELLQPLNQICFFKGIIRFIFIFWGKNCGRMMIYVSFFWVRIVVG